MLRAHWRLLQWAASWRRLQWAASCRLQGTASRRLPEVHGGEAVDDMDDMDPDHDHLNVVAGECDLCDYFKLRDKTVAERRDILIANDFM